MHKVFLNFQKDLEREKNKKNFHKLYNFICNILEKEYDFFIKSLVENKVYVIDLESTEYNILLNFMNKNIKEFNEFKSLFPEEIGINILKSDNGSFMLNFFQKNSK